MVNNGTRLGGRVGGDGSSGGERNGHSGRVNFTINLVMAVCWMVKDCCTISNNLVCW